MKETEKTETGAVYRPSKLALLGLTVSLGMAIWVLWPCLTVTTEENAVSTQAASGKLLYQVAVDEETPSPDASNGRVEEPGAPKTLVPSPHDMVMSDQTPHRLPTAGQPNPPTP